MAGTGGVARAGGRGLPFPNHLARERRLSASSQNQALIAVVFLYKHVLVDELPADPLGRFAAERAGRPARVPTVLSAAEVARLIDAMRSAEARDLPGVA